MGREDQITHNLFFLHLEYEHNKMMKKVLREIVFLFKLFFEKVPCRFISNFVMSQYIFISYSYSVMYQIMKCGETQQYKYILFT
jgi:hypothetical protein